MFHLLLNTDLGRAQTAEECLHRRWITQSFITAPRRRILGKLRRHTDYNRRPRVAGGYCLTERGPKSVITCHELDMDLWWGSREQPWCSCHTPAANIHTDALYGDGQECWSCSAFADRGPLLVPPPCPDSPFGWWLGGRLEAFLIKVLCLRTFEYGRL